MAFSSIYEFEYYDEKGVLNACEIHKEDGGFPVVPQTIQGYVTYSLSDVDGVDEAIRGSGLTLSLEASTTQTFSDLYVASEKMFLVLYYRDSVLKFKGWLISDGIFEDFVNDKWILDIDVTDGLSFLKDLSYVDSSGFIFSGKQSQLEIIVNCLARTGIGQNINTNIDIYYTGLSTSLDVLDNVYYNTDRFVKDDGDTIMDCDEVLRDVLEPYNAQIVSWNGEWWIFKANQLFVDDTPTFFIYNAAGSYLGTQTIDFSFDLGSQIDSYYPHHTNKNQLIRYNKSIGAYRISYKYGLVKSLLTNSLLQNISSVVADYTITVPADVSFPPSNYGVILSDCNAATTMISNNVALTLGDSLSYSGRFTLSGNAVYCITRVKLVGGSTYYLLADGTWTTTNSTIQFYNGVPNGSGSGNDFVGSGFEYQFNINTDALPVSGNLTIELYTPDIDPVTAIPSYVGECLFSEILISPSTGTDGIKGEFHTFQRETLPSTNVKDVKKVNVGDNPTDVYYGTIYKTDEITPTETWFRKGVTEAKTILELMGEETLMLSQSTAREFTGDVYGFVEPLSIITINNLTGLFIPLSLEYDSKRNITNIKLREIFNATLTDIDYELTYDYGNTVKPTIKG